MDTSNGANYLECGHNVNVGEFKVKNGCPAPYSCEEGPQLSISDSWFKVIAILYLYLALYPYLDKDYP